jgi:NAD(P)-dependent dehydrogenase (short-subunit alcohol dehydrogenase family)
VNSDVTLSAFITGGASGIGAATARRVLSSGGSVGIVDINSEMMHGLAKEFGDRLICSECDALDEAGLARTFQEFEQRMPPVNGLVNCAGLPPIPRRIEETSTAEFSRLVDSHLKSTFIACRVVGAAMAVRGGGAIVNIASVLSFRPGPVFGYGAAKAGVVNLTEALAVQWARNNVRVNAVAPGWTDTPFLRPKERGGERDLTPILNATPMGRLMQPAEIAEVIFFLLSPASSAVTGATVPCDGGVIAGSGWNPYGGFPKN